jgi:F420-non-reducing hydrogenase small subunit
MAVRLSEEWFAICGGCEVTILDIGEPLLDVLEKVNIVHMPVLMDHKLFGQTGEGSAMEVPEAEVGLLAGGVRTEEHRKLAQEMRKKCKTLIALGSCACSGGVPALANLYTTQEVFEKVYRGSKSTEPDGVPNKEIPPLTDRVYAVSEVVPVDMKLPGCPTTPEMVAGALTALLEGKSFSLPSKSVCDECPLIREKKATSTLKRRLEAPAFTPGRPLNEMRCLMEQGILCHGPATRSGCGGSVGTPRCIRAYMPCEGCFGPLSDTANPMVDMMGALSSIGLDPKQIPDRAATFNRFAGAGRLRPVPRPVPGGTGPRR